MCPAITCISSVTTISTVGTCLQLVLPETPAFLQADLSADPAAALAQAEGDHP